MKDLILLIRTLEQTNEKLERIAQALEYFLQEMDNETRLKEVKILE